MTLGQFFTPPALAAEILAAVPATPERVLDPACGDGSFLVEAGRRWPAARLAGYEADPRLAAAARRRVPAARIEVGDALEMPVTPEFDLVAGNPPFAAAFRDDADRDRVRASHRTARGSFDLAVPFVERAVGWLRPGGWLALVVTNKVLVKDYAAQLRAFLLDRMALVEVWDLAPSPVFPGAAIDVAVLVARRGPGGPTRVVLGRKGGGRESYDTEHLAIGPRGRWEVYRTPAISGILRDLEAGVRLGDLPGVTVRDGIQGRDYHKVALAEAAGRTDALPVVGVGRIAPGRVRWDLPVRRAGRSFANPRLAVGGALGAFCRGPKVLVRGVARRLVAAYCPEPAVPMVAVRAIAGHPEPGGLVEWLNSPLASFYLQATCRSDRIPGGSYNISKAWLQELPVPGVHAALGPEELRWLDAYGI